MHRKPKAFIKRYNRLLIGGTLLIFIILISVFAKLIAPYDPTATDVYNISAKPSSEHLLGTDSMGRDAFSRLIYGGRMSLLVGLGVGILSMSIGIVLGLIAGYYKKVDKILMRIMDGISAFPSILLALLLFSIMEGGVFTVVFALSISAIPGITRLIRSSVLSVKEQEHVESASAMGASDLRIMFQYILPLCSSPLLIRFTSTTASAILSEASLSFLGIGILPTIPTWGNMLSEGRSYLLTAPYLLYAPGIATILTVISINMIGDGLRDLLDTKLN